MKGKVINSNSGLYKVKTKDEIFKIKGSGKLRYSNESPKVGDYVEFDPEGFIVSIYERKNSLVRPKVSNVDQAIIVTSLVEPNYSSFLLNKFLAIIEHNRIKPIILFTKIDIANESHLEEYRKQGYQAYEIDNETGKGIDQLQNIFKDKVTVFTGQTGAGKSSTINSITNMNLKTDKISKSLGRGKHTTRMVEIYDWMGGELIDTPGFSSLEFDMTKLELSRAYHDFEIASMYCKFPRTCIHNKENNCEVKRLVEKGDISVQRYDDYLRLLEEAK